MPVAPQMQMRPVQDVDGRRNKSTPRFTKAQAGNTQLRRGDACYIYIDIPASAYVRSSKLLWPIHGTQRPSGSEESVINALVVGQLEWARPT